jgi:hypothetical protein
MSLDKQAHALKNKLFSWLTFSYFRSKYILKQAAKLFTPCQHCLTWTHKIMNGAKIAEEKRLVSALIIYTPKVIFTSIHFS